MSQPFEIVAPTRQTLPLVFASPHSGAHYPPEFLALAKLDRVTIRRSEDSFVDELFAGAVARGAPLLRALFPRAYVDVNREPYEFDPEMFTGPLPGYVNATSARVRSGLGTVARIVATGAEIYRAKLDFVDVRRRIDTLYMPYHGALKRLIGATRERFGFAILVDCHSMPSIGGPIDADIGHKRVDIVIGDRYGATCAPQVTEAAEDALAAQGLTVRRNDPYAGGFTAHHYGRPNEGVHALQIEVNRALYMDEERIRRAAGLARTASRLSGLIDALGALDLSRWRPLSLASE